MKKKVDFIAEMKNSQEFLGKVFAYNYQAEGFPESLKGYQRKK